MEVIQEVALNENEKERKTNKGIMVLVGVLRTLSGDDCML